MSGNVEDVRERIMGVKGMGMRSIGDQGESSSKTILKSKE
jgi:hypothetical protein